MNESTSLSALTDTTHHLQRDLQLIDQVVHPSNEQRMSFLSHYEHNICRNVVWTLEMK